MTPELRHCFSITIQVDKPIIVSRSPQTGKRQLIPIVGGSVSVNFAATCCPAASTAR